MLYMSILVYDKAIPYLNALFMIIVDMFLSLAKRMGSYHPIGPTVCNQLYIPFYMD